MDYIAIALGLVGGLGLFIYGMNLMGDGLQKVAGDKMRRLLEILTSNPVVAVVVGAGVTAIVGSSSATTVMVVGFVNAGLMALKQAIGVILGANIGTTISTQLISFNLAVLAEPALGIGIAVMLFSKKKKLRTTGQIIFGFGLIFYGMTAMGNAMRPLRTFEPFVAMLANFAHQPLLGILISALFTALVQSSSATTAIVVALASQGILSLESAMPLILGSNIGTTITAVIASINTNITARRAAVAHAIFNIGGALVFLFVLRPFAAFALTTSPHTARQVANAHTVFNILNTLMVLPFIALFTRMVVKLVPGKETPLAERQATIYLDDKFINIPSIALGQSSREVQRAGQIASKMLEEAMLAFETNDWRYINSAREKETLINYLEVEIVHYLVSLTEHGLSGEQSHELNSLFEAIHDIERIGDHADNLLELAEYRMEKDLPFSEDALEELHDMYIKVKKMVEEALIVLKTGDKLLAKKIIEEEDNIDQLEKVLRRRHIHRLNQRICYPGSGIVFVDIISNLERIADHATSIVQAVVGGGGA